MRKFFLRKLCRLSFSRKFFVSNVYVLHIICVTIWKQKKSVKAAFAAIPSLKATLSLMLYLHERIVAYHHAIAMKLNDAYCASTSLEKEIVKRITFN